MGNPFNPIVTETPGRGVEFRVIIRGLKLDAPTRELIDSAIRSAVLRELATFDAGVQTRILEPADDPQTRSVLLNLPLGLVVIAQELLKGGALGGRTNGPQK